MKTAVIGLVYVVGVYFVVRAVVELVTVDYGDSSSYSGDWGGPSLAGVLAVHCLPGVVAILAMIWGWRRLRRQDHQTRRSPEATRDNGEPRHPLPPA
jgi:hypothetical protein